MNTTFSQNDVLSIIEMYTCGKNIDEIIQAYETDEHFIREILKENNLDRNHHVGGYSDELKNRFIYLFNEGHTNAELTYELSLGKSAATKRIKQYGLSVTDEIKEKRTKRHEQMFAKSDGRNTRKRKYVYERNSNYFDEIDSFEKSYFLGLIYADGCNYKNRGVFEIDLQERDEHILLSLKNAIGYEGPLYHYDDSKRKASYQTMSCLQISDNHICESLEKHGVVERKSLVLKFPEFLNDELIPHFIRGYVDGDGCIYYSKNNGIYCSLIGTKDFCFHIKDILASKGIKCSVYHRDMYNENTYILSIGGPKQTYRFLDWIYSCSTENTRLSRKYELYLECCNNYNDVKIS